MFIFEKMVDKAWQVVDLPVEFDKGVPAASFRMGVYSGGVLQAYFYLVHEPDYEMLKASDRFYESLKKRVLLDEVVAEPSK